MSEILGYLIYLTTLALGLCFYFLPTIVAVKSKHRSVIALFLLNLFLGWTIAGWVIALVWAFMKPPQIAVVPGASSADELLKLSELREKGVLSEEEFAEKKQEILHSGNSAKNSGGDDRDIISPTERVRRIHETQQSRIDDKLSE